MKRAIPIILLFLTAFSCFGWVQYSDTNQANFFKGPVGVIDSITNSDFTGTNIDIYHNFNAHAANGSYIFGFSSTANGNAGGVTMSSTMALFCNYITAWQALELHIYNGSPTLGISFYPNNISVSGTPTLRILTNRVTLATGQYEGNGGGISNIYSTNITVVASTLAASSGATNYTIPLLPGASGNMLTIYTANTNVFISFTGTNTADAQRTVAFRGWTNTVPTVISFGQVVRTNLYFDGTILDGLTKVIGFYNLDSSGTNVLVKEMGTFQ